MKGRLVDPAGPFFMPMVKAKVQASYLIHCRGKLPDGSACVEVIGLSLTGKAVCTICGEVYPPYRTFVRDREPKLINK